MRLDRRRASALVAAVAAALAVAPAAVPAGAPGVRTLRIHSRSYDGCRRAATVLFPAGYDRREGAELPLVISPHGRGLTGRANATAWGSLPALGNFVVV